MSIPKLINKALPSIVSIDVKVKAKRIRAPNGYHQERSRRHQQPRDCRRVNGGTITVTRTGSTKALPATLIGTNPIDDVALIRINNISGLTPVTFGNSNDLVVATPSSRLVTRSDRAGRRPSPRHRVGLGRTVTAAPVRRVRR